MAKFLDVIWFNKVGIVKVEDEWDGIKYYIKDVKGIDEFVDTKDVMDWGATFPKVAGDYLFNEFVRY